MRKLTIVTFALVVLGGLVLAAPKGHIWGNAGTKIEVSDEEEISNLSPANQLFSDFCLEARNYVVKSIKSFNHPIIFEAYEELFEMLDGSIDASTGRTHYATVHDLVSMDNDARAKELDILLDRNEYREIFGDLYKVCNSVIRYNQHLVNMFDRTRSGLAPEKTELQIQKLGCKSTDRVVKAYELCLVSDLKNRYMDHLEKRMMKDLNL